MKNLHIEKITVNDTNLDFDMKLSLLEIIRFLQLTTFNHSNEIMLDHKTMQEKSNAFWVITKMKVKINKDVTSGDNLKVATWTQPLSIIRAIRDFSVKQKNCIVASASAEWCCLDMSTRKIRKLSTIQYPDLEMVKTDSSKLNFENLNQEYKDSNFVYSRTIRSSDIDVNNHTNNLKYNSMALDAFTVEELNGFLIKEYEIHFVNESIEGEVIEIYKKKVGLTFFVEGRIGEKVIFKVCLKVRKKLKNYKMETYEKFN